MFIRETKKVVRGKAYKTFLLVESVRTPQGPRQQVVCSLGNLEPAPKEHWLQLAKKLENALSGQLSLISAPEPVVDTLVEKVRSSEQDGSGEQVVPICVEAVTVEDACEAGPVHVGHQIWHQLGMDEVLQEAGLDERACALTEILAVNRLARPASERATRSWLQDTALPDILGNELCELGHNTLYRHLDKLHEMRDKIEAGIAEREQTLFNLDRSILLYDLTSSFFEGACKKNPQAKHGYSRDGRPDCKQVVVGLVVDRERFSVAHEVFDGNRLDATTVGDMLDVLDRRAGSIKTARTVVVDRGMASGNSLNQIVQHGHHYVVAANQKERDVLLAEFGEESGWSEVNQDGSQGVLVRRVPADVVQAIKEKRWQVKQARVQALEKRTASESDPEKLQELNKKADRARTEEREALAALQREELYVLCKSGGRSEKDKAIREKQEGRLLADLKKLSGRVESEQLKALDKINQAIGRLKERYQRVARYYDINVESGKLIWTENEALKGKAQELDGSYLLKTDNIYMTDVEVWHTYILLTRVEAAFRDLKSPLMERPIHHQLQHRVQAHIFVCVLAYHLLAAIEKKFRDQDISTSWETIREVLRTHQVVTIKMPTADGRVIRIRRATTPHDRHKDIYDVLRIPHEVIRPRAC